MIFTETEIKGVYVIDIEPIEDDRGFFARGWCKKEWEALKLNSKISQCNISFTAKKNVLRGMHYQLPPFQEAKLIWCTRGGIYDVAIDLRPESGTYRKWISISLSAENRRMLYIPENCAHGYQTMEDNSEVIYMVTEFYHPECEAGIRWDDPAIGIEWPEAKRNVSEKDMSWPFLKD